MTIDTAATTLMKHQPVHKHLAGNVRLMSQFRQDRILAFVFATAQQMQRYEDAAFGYLLGILLDYAIGDQLDKWGGLVGEIRGGLEDDDYRRFVQARILANRSKGTTDELVKIMQLVTDPGTVRRYELPPAGLELVCWRNDPMPENVYRRAGDMLRAAKPAGVAMELVEVVTGWFSWFGDPGAEGYDRGGYSRSF